MYQHTREWLEVTLASVGDAVVATDLEARVVLLNPIAERLTGWTQREAQGRPVDEIFVILNERTREPAQNPALRALAEGSIQGLANHTILIARDGSERGIDDSAAPIRDAEGRIYGVVLVFRDVTAQREAERRRAARLAVTQILAQGASTEESGQRVVEALARELGWDAACLWMLDEQAQVLRHRAAWSSSGSGLEAFLAQECSTPLARGVGLAGRAWSENGVVWLENGASDLRSGAAAGPLEMAVGLGPALEVRPAALDRVPSGLACPIPIDGKCQGALVLYSRVHQEPDDDLAETVSTLAAQLGQFTQRRRAQADLQRSERTLRFLHQASESLADLVDYRSTLQRVAGFAVPDFADWCAIHMAGPDGEIEQVAWVHRDPTRAEQVLEAFLLHPLDPNQEYGVPRVLRTGKPELVRVITDEMLQTAARTPDHLRLLRELRLSSSIIVPLRSKEGVIGALRFVTAESGRRYTRADLATAQDLASRAAIAIENALLYERSRESERRKDEFIATLAHELRNPLAPIRSGLDVLSIDPSSLTSTVKIMRRQLDHLVRLADDLLDVSRITHGKVELRRETMELGAVLDAAVTAVRGAAERSGHQVVVTRAAEPIWLDADPVRVLQVIENLLNNAIKYTDSGGRIEAAIERDGDFAVIRVRDDGIGIDPEHLAEIFEPFTQASSGIDRSQGGLGIGLTLVRHFVTMHGGTVSASSAGPGQGSEFVTRLPIGKAPSAQASTDESPGTGRPESRCVLVVDDNVGAASMLALLLSRLGADRVETAADGFTAVRKAEELLPDVILLDIGLPGMDGYQVARELRQRPELDRAVLVALTGYGQEQDRARSREAGFDEHLVKPASVGDLQRVLTMTR
jgi:PAS domain S-box-containing protein